MRLYPWFVYPLVFISILSPLAYPPFLDRAPVLKAREDQIPLGLTILGGQHPRLGFHLGAEDIARLAALGVSIDFDEYGDEYE